MRRTCRNPLLSLVFSTCFLLLALSGAQAGTIVVKPGRLERFQVTVPGSAVAGESFIVRIDPYDANGNLITDPPAKGNVFDVRASGSARVSPDKIRPSDFAGGITVTVTDKVTEVVEIAVIESGAQTPLASARVPVLPNKLDHFSLSVPKAAVSGEPFQCRIIARDAFGNQKIDLPDVRSSLRVEFSGSGTLRQVERQMPPLRSGEIIVSFEPLKAGKVKIAVEEQTTHSRGESADVEIRPAGLDHFVVQVPKAAVAGEEFSLTLTAMDKNENVVTGYQDQGDGVLLIPSGGGTLEPNTVAAKGFRSGQIRVNVSYTIADTLRITAREMNRDLSGVSEAIVIVPADPDHFLVKTPDEAVAGEPFTIEILALDRFNNQIEDYDLRGLEVYLSTDGTGQISPASVSPSVFSKGRATVEISYSRAESFSVIAALSKEDLEKIAKERTRRAPAQPSAAPLTPEEIALEKEREQALRAREEAMRARTEIQEQQKAREEAVKAREEAQRAMEEATISAPEPRQPPPSAPTERPTALEEAPPPPAPEAPARVELPKPPPPSAPVQVAKRRVQELTQVSFVESMGQGMVMIETTGPVSYNASTGSSMSKEWIYVEIFPVQREGDKVADLVKVDSDLVGDILVEDLEDEKVKVSLQVLPPGISYVVSQQDRAVVVKIIKND